MRTMIKICGVTNEKDVNFISMLDVDFIGFNLVSGSKRAVSENALKKLVSMVPSYINSVAVMVNPELKDVKRIIKKTGISFYQLHGDESVDFVREVKELGVKVIKAFRFSDGDSVEKALPYAECADYLLVDSFSPETPGGTGIRYSADIAKQVKGMGLPMFLAGGLDPDNAAEAVSGVEPFAVDTASGVENSPRSKDIEKVRAFIRAVRGA
ncbi:MAG: phosphoribosylanthranilate isomerase [Candidatus Omnitrophota bacterium]|nr:phosphoribosylanthranilate isomerase [Candidatus Omnitrophota bacterium]